MKLYKTVTEYQDTDEIKTREFTSDDIKNIMDHHNVVLKLEEDITIIIDAYPKL